MTEGMYDQALAVSDILRSALNMVDRVVDQSIQDREDHAMVGLADGMRSSVHVSGVALAKLLYHWREQCQNFGIMRDDFPDYIFARTGINPQTTKKYSDMWEQVAVNSGLDEERLIRVLSKPITGLLLLPAAIREGQVQEETWTRIESAPDGATIREIVRELRGTATSSATAIRIVLGRDGTLTAWQNGVSEAIGYLNTETRTAFGTAAVERILRSVGIVET